MNSLMRVEDRLANIERSLQEQHRTLNQILGELKIMSTTTIALSQAVLDLAAAVQAEQSAIGAQQTEISNAIAQLKADQLTDDQSAAVTAIENAVAAINTSTTNIGISTASLTASVPATGDPTPISVTSSTPVVGTPVPVSSVPTTTTVVEPTVVTQGETLTGEAPTPTTVMTETGTSAHQTDVAGESSNPSPVE